MLAKDASYHSRLLPAFYSNSRSGTQHCFHKPYASRTCARTCSSTAGPIGSSLFTGKGTHHASETTAVERISQLLEHHRLKTWGFVIYRCTYGNDIAWSRFVDRLNERRNALLTSKYGVEDPDDALPKEVARRLDWRVQEDPTLDGASKDEVRRRFRRLVEDSLVRKESDEAPVSSCAKSENPRWNFCVHVDQGSLESVLQASTDSKRAANNYAYVNLVRADEYWDHPDYDRFDWSSYVPAEEDDEHDEGEEEIEGCRLAELGWMKVRADDLIPHRYALLMERDLWHIGYVRPPEISKH